MFRFLFCLLTILTFSSSSVAQQAQQFREVPIFKNGMDGYACYRIPAIIKAANGDLLAFAEGRVNSCNDFGKVNIVLKKSTDNGLNWSAIEIVASNGRLQAGNPAPVLDLLDLNYSQGRIFLFFNTGNNHEGAIRKGDGLREVWYITSTDHGENWSAPVNITAKVHRPNKPAVHPNYNFKEDWRSYANTPGHAIQLQQAKYQGRIFVPANHSEGKPTEGFNEYRAHAFYSDDHGLTWQLSANVDVPSSNESIAVELKDGTVLQNIRHQSGTERKRLIALSKDGGAHWDTAYFDQQLPSPVCQASIINYTTKNGKDVLLFSNPNSTNKRENMTVRVSFDEGQNWLLSRVVREGEAAYSDLVIQEDRQIGLLYEHGNDGGIHYAHFNFEWLINGKNNTDNLLVQKLTKQGNNFSEAFDFALSAPIIESDSIIFEKSTKIKLQLGLKNVRLRFTLDGSTPTEQSTIYRAPISLRYSAMLKVRAFHKHYRPSPIIEKLFIRLNPDISIKDISINNEPNENYKGKGAKGLIDRKKGNTNFRTSEWMGFSGVDFESIITLAKKSDLKKITISLLEDQGAWIFLPKTIEIYSVSKSNDLTLIASKELASPKQRNTGGLKFIEIPFEPTSLEQLKIVIKPWPTIPDYHPGTGKPPWLFIDEILLD